MNAAHLVDAGLWAEVRVAKPIDPGAILLLDRDGVIIEDTGYVANAAQAQIYPDAPAAIARAKLAGFRVAVVTNQSGIGRGMYGWNDFNLVQEKIDAALTAANTSIDALFACAYHHDAKAPYNIRDHTWRKPQPGMILEALKLLNGHAFASALIGDRDSDIAASRAANLGRAILIDRDARARLASADAVVTTLDDAVSLILTWHNSAPGDHRKVAIKSAAIDRN